MQLEEIKIEFRKGLISSHGRPEYPIIRFLLSEIERLENEKAKLENDKDNLTAPLYPKYRF
jgi:hypothetical protein